MTRETMNKDDETGMTERDARAVVAGGVVRAPRGAALSCKGWEQEAALRMLMNCADPEVAERSGRTSDGDNIRATIAALHDLEGDQTLLVRSGEPERVFRTRAEVPRVVIVDHGVAGLDEAGVASWLCLGTQTGLPAMYEAFTAAARKRFGGTLAGRLVAACGMGATGAALPLASTLNGAAFLGIEADAEQIKRRVKSGYCEAMVNDLDEALRMLKNSVRRREPASVGLIGNCADVIPELASRGIVPDLLIDCTPAYGSLDGYVPSGLTAEQARELRRADAENYRQRALDSIAAQIRGILELKRLGSMLFRFGGGVGESAQTGGVREGGDIPDFGAEYIEPLRSEGRSLMLWVALSGAPADIARADRVALEVFSADEASGRWIRLVGKHVQFQGLPARVCLVDRALQAGFGLALNDLVAQGALKGPMVIGCGDFGDGSEAAAALAATAADATSEDSDAASRLATLDGLLAGLTARARHTSWVAIEEGNRRSAGGSLLPMLAVVADGTAAMARKIEGVLGDTSSAGATRPADAGRGRRDADG
jgi:urocanate hydratase